MHISAELNKKLTQVGPGTPMGEVFRRYWMPAALASELPEPDGAPIRVRLLGEDLVAFRDSAGEVGLVDAYCAHRRAPLFYGRNEECGLRCVYHGWKYDTLGNCVDMPSEPPFSKFRLRVSVKAYPTHESGGVIWAYLGPTELMPPPPDYEWMRVDADHFRIDKTGEACNYLQAIEGGIDTAHSSFAHNNDLGNTRLLRQLDPHPRLDVDLGDYGFTYASLRNVGNDTTYLRVYQFFMPCQHSRGTLVSPDGSKPKVPKIDGHIWVPIDDENTWVYNWMYAADESAEISDEWWERHEHLMGRGPEDFIPGTYWLKAAPENDFFIDREVQKSKTFTGITGINTQDFALQAGMGRIVDRSLEALGSTDLAVQAARRLLVEAMDDAAAGRPLKGTDPQTCDKLRGADMLVPHGSDWREVSKEALQAYW
jgi:phenylpropionate dioxygenase-like ring-hydroxylating dioxygenase large terminal subunit